MKPSRNISPRRLLGVILKDTPKGNNYAGDKKKKPNGKSNSNGRGDAVNAPMPGDRPNPFARRRYGQPVAIKHDSAEALAEASNKTLKQPQSTVMNNNKNGGGNRNGGGDNNTLPKKAKARPFARINALPIEKKASGMPPKIIVPVESSPKLMDTPQTEDKIALTEIGKMEQLELPL